MIRLKFRLFSIFNSSVLNVFRSISDDCRNTMYITNLRFESCKLTILAVNATIGGFGIRSLVLLSLQIEVGR